MDKDTYRSLTIEQRAERATSSGPIEPDLLDLVLEDHNYVIAALVGAEISDPGTPYSRIRV